MDMHSGGGSKEDYDMIYIEAPQDVAEIVFYNRFGHNPNNVGCSCCGENYSISEEENLEQLTAYERNCEYDDATRKYIEVARTSVYYKWEHVSLEDYLTQEEVLIIYAHEIQDHETRGSMKRKGWVYLG
jgi:hypothetical protein